MRPKSVKANTILNIIRLSLTVVFPLITFPYTTRIFLTEGNGKINFATSVVQIFVLFASLGIYSYGVREGAKVRNDRASFSKLAQELLLINVVSTFITYIAFFTVIFAAPHFHDYRKLLLINSLLIGFTALGVDWVYGVYEEYLYITVRQIIIQIFTICAMFLFVHGEEDLYRWVFLTVISAVGANLFNFVHARKYIDFKIVRISFSSARKHIAPVTALFATQLAAKVYSNMDTVLLGGLATDHNTGLYSAAVKVNTILITCFTAMSPVFMPRIIEFIKGGEREKYYSFLKKIFALVLSLTLPTVVGMEMLSKPIIILLAGEAFTEAAITMRILAPLIAISACANILYYDVLVPHGKEKEVLFCTLTGAVINLVISCILIPRYVQNGAAIGSLISESVALGMAAAFCYRQDQDILKSIPRVGNYLLGSLLVAMCCLVITVVISGGLLQLFFCVLTGAAGYGLLLILLKDIVGQEAVKVIKKLMGKIFIRRF